MNCLKISVIVAFYKGNKFLHRLFSSINEVARNVRDKALFEVILVNDSPDVEIELPNIAKEISLKTIKNKKNWGIQKTRVNGIKAATGDWILILDQDDELVADGFSAQIELTNGADVVVGNGLYQHGTTKKLIYRNKNSMDYLIQKERFIKIRNLIPSPGECLIRKQCIPDEWMEFHLQHNGADDWLLWIMLFQDGRKFVCNREIIYIHNDASGQNLSLDLEKMHESAVEMCKVLKGKLRPNDIRTLRRAVEFKYLQDTGKLDLIACWKYRKCILNNVVYKIKSR